MSDLTPSERDLLAALDRSMDLYTAEHHEDVWDGPTNLAPMLDAECVLDPVDRGTSWRFVLPVLAVIFLVPWALIALVAWVGWLVWGAVR